MKKHLLILFAVALVSFETSAQVQQAMVNQKGEIILDASQPLQEKYQLSADEFNF
jgi:hypothetical protein